MKTVNRGWLRRQVEAGRVEAKCDYHYTDDYAYDAAYGFGKTDWMACRIRHPQFERDANGYDRCVKDDFVEGQINFHASDFDSKCGRAYECGEGLIAFTVHSNLSYTLRIRPHVQDGPETQGKDTSIEAEIARLKAENARLRGGVAVPGR